VINPGDKVVDKITEYEGIAVARCTYLNGCVRILVQAQAVEKDKGVPVEAVWIDEGQLTLIEAEAITPDAEQVAAAPAGPRDAPQRAPDPPR